MEPVDAEPAGGDVEYAAAELFARGEFAAALDALAPLLLRDTPPSARTLNLAAVCALRLGRLPDAEALFTRALAAYPEDADLHHNFGSLLWEAGRYAEAEASYRRALARCPASDDIRRNFANLLDTLDRPEASVDEWRWLVSHCPRDADAHYGLGLALKRLGSKADAEAAYRAALALQPDHANVYNSLGVLLGELGRHAEARDALRQAIALRPDYADAHNNLGVLYRSIGQPAAGEASYRRAIAFRPDHAEAWNNLGVLLHDVERDDEAEHAYRQALAVRGDYAEAWNNLGIVLWESKRLDDAETAYRRAAAIRPGHADAWNNLGVLLYDLDRLSDAEAAYRRALSIQPERADLSYNLAHLLLATGRFDEGWQRYRTRDDPSRAHRTTRAPDVACPEWRGEPLHGRSLLVWHEQGFGDMIQFGRYLPLLKAMGAARITLACPTALLCLFEAADCIDVLTDSVAAAQLQHDYWTYPLSLPLRVGTTIDSIPPARWLRADPALIPSWREKLAPLSGRRIGIMWQGNRAHRNDHNRSLPSLATLAPLWSVPDTCFVSLQKGEEASEAAAAEIGQPLLSLGAELRDFADTAALMTQLDLVICVDSAVAHLAGSLGVPCWVLLSAMQTDWRWMKTGDTTPWYLPTARLFRQTSVDEDWAHVVERVRQACISTLPQLLRHQERA